MNDTIALLLLSGVTSIRLATKIETLNIAVNEWLQYEKTTTAN